MFEITWKELQELRADPDARPWTAESDREDLVGILEELAIMVVEVTGVALEEIEPAARLDPERQAELVDVAIQAAIKRYTERARGHAGDTRGHDEAVSGVTT